MEENRETLYKKKKHQWCECTLRLCVNVTVIKQHFSGAPNAKMYVADYVG